MFNFVPFKLLINVHSKLSKATTIGKTFSWSQSILLSQRKDYWELAFKYKKDRKSKHCPSSNIVMLTGVFRKRSLRGNRSGYLRMKWVVWLKCIITFDNSHTFYKVYFLFFGIQNVWGIIVWLHTDEVLASPPALRLAKKTNRNDFPSNIGKQSHQLFLSSTMDGMTKDCKNKDWCEDTLTSISELDQLSEMCFNLHQSIVWSLQSK